MLTVTPNIVRVKNTAYTCEWREIVHHTGERYTKPYSPFFICVMRWEILLRGCIRVSGAPGGAGSDAPRVRRRYSGQRRGATPSAGGRASRQVPRLRLPTASWTGAPCSSTAVHNHRLGKETEFRCLWNWYPSRSIGNRLCIVKVVLYFWFIFQAKMERRFDFGVIFSRCIQYYCS